MPIYEYQCQDCGHNCEFLEKLSDIPQSECPGCHKPSLKRLVSAAGFQLKGTGWYATDFKDQGKKPNEKAAPKSEEKPKTDGTETKSTETPAKSTPKDDKAGKT